MIPFAEAAQRVRARRSTEPELMPVLIFAWPLVLALHLGAGVLAASIAMWGRR